jgi:DNA-binding transcriptional MerR regulator
LMDFKKLYYKIGDVCEILGVEAHVLRYWESEFPNLSPPKNKAGQRTYRPKDIELLLEIRRLLYDEGFTIAGARKRLVARGPSTPHPPPKERAVHQRARKSKPARTKAPSRKLTEVREELENILTLLRRE